MRITLALSCVLRAFILSLALVFLSQSALAQTPAIQPCEATPSPAKPAVLNAPAKISTRATETLVDASVPADESVEKLIAPYSGRVKALSVVIGRVDGELKTGGIGSNTMGNFVVDGIMTAARAKLGNTVVLAVTNGGGLRKRSIAPGELKTGDIFELLPFENALVQIDLSGTQLLTLLQRVTAARDAQAGARIKFRWNEEDRPEFISAKLVDATGREQDIDPQRTYTIVTIDYLLKLASGNYAILQEGRNVKPLNLTLRDAVTDYVKAETGAGRPIRARLDDRFVQIGPGPARTEGPPND